MVFLKWLYRFFLIIALLIFIIVEIVFWSGPSYKECSTGVSSMQNAYRAQRDHRNAIEKFEEEATLNIVIHSLIFLSLYFGASKLDRVIVKKIKK